jgi:hypothetical protein
MKWRECALLALPWGLALAGPPTTPVNNEPVTSAAADADLLEFLGSVDSDEAGWHDYLEQTDLEKVIRAPAKAAPQPTQGNDQ